MKKTILTFCIIILSINISAQYFSTGSDPSRLKWRQIKTPYVRLIFEENFEKEALRLAYMFDSVAPLVAGTMKHQPRRIDVLLHNQMSYSNGMVSWAPKRAEFFTMPHQNITSTDWLKELAIHEYRHVVQVDKLNKGITKAASYLLGQQAVGITFGFNLPMWFVEGDAVMTETSLTQSGRGRSHTFNQELKAQLVERDKFSFDKAYMGSYKDNVPNYYKMGFPLVAMARQQYGAELWENVVEKTGRRNVLSRMDTPLKRATGLNSRKMYDAQFSKLREIWTDEVNSHATTLFSEIIEPKEDYAIYKYPKVINDSILICELTGNGIRSQIVEINILSRKTKTLIYTGLREEEPISANENIIVWSELEYDIRWENESFSVIRTYDYATGKTARLGKHTRFSAPAIHPQMPVVAAVEATTDYKFFVTILDAVSGKVIKRIPTPDNQFVLTPSWNQAGGNLVAVLLNDNGKALYSLDTEHETWRMIIPHSFDEKCHPIQSGNDIWYAAKGSISQEIYYHDLITGNTSIVTSSRFGAAFPAVMPKSKQIFYSHYIDKGYYPVKFMESEVKPDLMGINESFIDRLSRDMSNQEAQDATSIAIPEREYKSEKYSKLNIINPHSWAPVFVDINNEKLYFPGVSLMSQNILGTSILNAGYNHNEDFRNEKFYLDYSYLGLYPVFRLNFTYGDEALNEDTNIMTDKVDTFTMHVHKKLHHFRIKPSIEIPFDLSSGNYQRRLTPEVRLNIHRISGYPTDYKYYTRTENGLVPTGQIKTINEEPVLLMEMDYMLYFYNLRRGTSRDVASRMGQVIQFQYAHTPFGNYNAGSVFGIYTRLFFPGLMRYHSLSVDNGYQIKINGEKSGEKNNNVVYRRFGNAINYPRGYKSNDIYNAKLYVLRSNYMLPLFNPDFSLSSLMYLKRVRMNLFYDMAFANYTLESLSGQKVPYKNRYSSTGLELYVDVHLMRFTLPFSFGYRTGYRDSGTKFFHEFLLSTSFGSFLVNDRK